MTLLRGVGGGGGGFPVRVGVLDPFLGYNVRYRGWGGPEERGYMDRRKGGDAFPKKKKERQKKI